MNSFNIFKISLFTIMVSVSIVTNAQQTKTVSVSNFQEISVSGGIDLYLSQAGGESVKIIAHADLIDKVLIEKSGNQLRVRYKENTSWSRIMEGQNTKVYVNYKTLLAISASGGSDVVSQNTIKTERLSAHASGGSDMKLNVSAKDIQVETSGGSDVYLKGSAVNMTANASGGSDIDALGFTVEYAKVNASGGSDINVNVSKGLEANASGGSDINYKGNAAVKKTSSSKSGDVKRLN
ncbi:MAG: head GIN domain-containing protein [Bacteroidota bacterium]